MSGAPQPRGVFFRSAGDKHNDNILLLKKIVISIRIQNELTGMLVRAVEKPM